MQRLSNLLLLCAVVALFATGCRKDIDNPVDGGNNTPTVTTTIIGVVSDESGAGMSGVAVSAHGITSTTNEHGLFIIKDVRVPQDRCFVLATSDGCFTGSRAVTPKAGGVTNMRLSLMRNTATYSVDAMDGGVVNISEGGSIQLPANGYVGSDGRPYSGTVKVAARWLNPTASDFFSFFPGDFAATRTDGSRTELHSYGVLNVELMSQTGEKLQLASGKRATLKYPIPSSILAGAPAEMPLWYFDETLGMWKEDGRAVKQGDFYIGEVSHFTYWNCDIPALTARIRGRVLCGWGPVEDIIIKIGQREVISDENGYYECAVPTDLVFDIRVDAAKNMGLHTEEPIIVGPLSSQQVLNIDVPVGPCPSYLTGTLVDCNGQPTEGVVQVKGSVIYGYVAVRNGQFRIRVEPGASVTMDAIGYNTGVSDMKNVQGLAPCSEHGVGSIGLCPQQSISFTDIKTDLGTSEVMALSPDGSRIAVTDYQTLKVYDTYDGTVLYTRGLPKGHKYMRLSFSTDGSLLLITAALSPSELRNGSIAIVDTKTWYDVRTMLGVATAVLTPDAKSVIAADFPSRDIVRYDIATGKETGRYNILGPPTMHGPLMLGTRAGGRQFICHTYDYETFASHIVIWDMVDNVKVSEFAMSLRNYPASVHFSADGLRMLEEASNGMLNMYNVMTGQIVNSAIVKTGDGKTPASGLSPDGKRYVVQVYDKDVPMLAGVFNADDGAPLYMLPSPGAYQFTDYAYTNNGSTLAGLYNGNHHAEIRIWRLP